MEKRDAERCRAILVTQRESISKNATRVRKGELEHDQDDCPDEMDMALAEASVAHAGRIRERESTLLSEIDEALERIEQGDYGECTSCGEEIGLERLRARPVAEFCIACKDEQERLEHRAG